MLNATMMSMLEDRKDLTIATIEVKVEMNPSKLAEKLAHEIYQDMTRLCNFVGITEMGVEESGILNYLKTLTYLRVSLANGDTSKALNNYRNVTKRLAIPVMFYQCLISMGVALDRDYAIRFVPTYSIDSVSLLSPEEMIEISDLMLRLETHGLKIVVGVPREEEGELDFMALCHVEEQVLGYRHSHPVYGFLASFFAQKELSEVTGAMCRVLYGYESDYQLYVTQLYHALSK